MSMEDNRKSEVREKMRHRKEKCRERRGGDVRQEAEKRLDYIVDERRLDKMRLEGKRWRRREVVWGKERGLMKKHEGEKMIKESKERPGEEDERV